jgi:hypothetical protein
MSHKTTTAEQILLASEYWEASLEIREVNQELEGAILDGLD